MIKQTKQINFLFDFDSTFIQCEGLDELAEIALQHHPDREHHVKQIKKLTNQGMSGTMPFAESLRERIQLLECNEVHIKSTGELLKKKISTSILRNKLFFQNNKEHIYIISGGFKELIIPVVKDFGITEDHIFANTFIFDQNKNVVGIDRNNPMSQNGGKVQVARSLEFRSDLYIIGDGYTDYELKKYGLAKKFIAFTENIAREKVVEYADEIAPTFDDFLSVHGLT